MNRIDLTATYCTASSDGSWKETWSIRDASDCPGLDVSGNFFAGAVAFTDLDRDGVAEVTVACHLFCGGVDPNVVKLIYRDGARKFAIRGESVPRVPGQAPIGGEHQHDKTLQPPSMLLSSATLTRSGKKSR